jgi:hypothetical protein
MNETLMSLEESSFEWIETADAVTVRLPAPPGEPAAMTWTSAALILITILVLVTALLFGLYAPRDATFWLILAVLIVALGFLLRATIARLRREAKAPRPPSEPSMLVIADGVLKIERAGPDRGMNYSWELTEIADLSMSNAALDRAFPSPRSLVAHGLSQEQVIRISVQRRSGEVDDITLLSTGRFWADSLETRLRNYLKLSPAARSANSETGHG